LDEHAASIFTVKVIRVRMQPEYICTVTRNVVTCDCGELLVSTDISAMYLGVYIFHMHAVNLSQSLLCRPKDMS
jgi:hypothetical protein